MIIPDFPLWACLGPFEIVAPWILITLVIVLLKRVMLS